MLFCIGPRKTVHQYWQDLFLPVQVQPIKDEGKYRSTKLIYGLTLLTPTDLAVLRVHFCFIRNGP